MIKKIHIKFVIACVSVCLSTFSLIAQAPEPPITESNMNKIDSLSMLFLESIPAHTEKDKQLLFSDPGEEVFRQKMTSLGSSIPFDYNEFVSLQVRYMTRYSMENINRVHARMQIYFPIFESVLDKYNLPQELKFVSIIESNLNPVAKSWCGATGLWQFMPYTGRYMGMTINNKLDERKSIEISTEKACEYFLSSYRRFGDWLLAIASYNCGPGNVQKAINASGGKTTFWEIKRFLPKETQNYIPKFIAAAYTFSFSGFAQNNISHQSMLLAPIVLTQDLETRFLTNHLGVSKSDIFAYNKELLNESKIEANTRLLLPYNWAQNVISNTDTIFYVQERVQKAEYLAKPVFEKRTVTQQHVVKKGESYVKVARKFGITVASLKKENSLTAKKLKAGTNLKITKVSMVKVRPALSIEQALVLLDSLENVPLVIENTTEENPTLEMEDILEENTTDSEIDLNMDSPIAKPQSETELELLDLKNTSNPIKLETVPNIKK